MPKKAYVGVSNKAKNVVKVRLGVDNIARNVLKGYVGDENGIAKQWWPPGNAWNDYAGVRLVFDYDYKPGITYTRHKAGILDTIRYGIQKNIMAIQYINLPMMILSEMACLSSRSILVLKYGTEGEFRRFFYREITQKWMPGGVSSP